MRSLSIKFFIVLGLVFPALTSAATPAGVGISPISDDRVFAYAEANYSSLFAGTPTAGQYLQYNYRYYPASGNYLAVDTAGVIYILGPYTGNVITDVSPVESLRGHITEWEAATVPYAIVAQDISGNCTLYTSSFEGVLTPTGQADIYTTVFVGGTAITLTVPGGNAVNYSYAEGGGVTTDNMQLTFDLPSRSITGSINWTHTNDCYGYSVISGSW